MPGATTFVTIADAAFGKGAVALAKTLAAYSDQPLICLDLGLEEPERHALVQLGAEVRSTEPVTAAFAAPKWAPSLSKLPLFGWEEFERVAYLDADVIVTGPLDELLERPEPFAACPDYGIELSDERFNAGVMSLRPDRAVERELFALIDETEPGFWPEDRSDPRWLDRHPSDQGLLNLHFAGRWGRLDPAFNVSKRLAVHHPELWAQLEPRMRVLHFIGHKPWWPATGEARERGYEALEERWWKAYES